MQNFHKQKKKKKKIPGLYLRELCQYIYTATGTNVSGSTVCRVLQKNELTRKKIVHIAKQRCLEYWGKFMAEILQYPPEWLVIKIISASLVIHWSENHQFIIASLDVHQNFGNCCSLYWRPYLLWTDHWNNQWWQAVWFPYRQFNPQYASLSWWNVHFDHG